MLDQNLLDEIKGRLDRLNSCEEIIKKQDDELNKVNTKLTEAEALKSHFISNITNEIINPFASILGLSRNIVDTKECDITKVKNMAELIHSEAFELDFQLKNIFTAAKLEAGELAPEYIKTDIKQLIQSVIESHQYKAEQKQLDVNFTFTFNEEFDAQHYFVTDPAKLRLILANLLSNSIKFSNAANRIEITGAIENKVLKIAVKDFGIGIDKQNLDLIFDRFKRIDSSIHSHNQGHGLGLSVVKSMLDTMEGEIDIVSQSQMGSIFSISMPEGQSLHSDGLALDGNEIIFDDGDNEIF